jgi:hypothetical protein
MQWGRRFLSAARSWPWPSFRSGASPCWRAIQPQDFGSLWSLVRLRKKPENTEPQRMKQSDSEEISTKKRISRHR